MGMSVWGLIAAPLLVSGGPGDTTPMAAAITAPAGEMDIFSGDSVLNEQAMSDASGGADTAFHLDNVGVNIANADANVSDISADGAQTGQIANNVIQDNKYSFVTINSGIGVSINNILQINIFLNGAGGE